MSDSLNETVLGATSDTETPPPPGVAAVQLPENFGRYRVQKLLGRGGMGSVWLATDTQLQRSVALKVPAFARDCPKEMLQRFYREAQSAATLSHPGICPVYDVGQHDGIHYITMGFIDGRPLTDYIKSGKEQGERSIALLIRKLALALHEAHQKGIIHRDLKPANVMINQRNEPIVMDFGLARQITEDRDTRMTREGLALGSPGYMSPEQVQGRADLGPATDIYSLGVVLYELLTGEPPFTGNVLSVLHQITQTEPRPPQQIRPGLSAGMSAICRKAMAKRPEDRYRSMRELAEAVTAFVKAEGSTTADVPLIPHPAAEPAVTAEYPAVKAPLVKTRKLPAQTQVAMREPVEMPVVVAPPRRRKSGKRKQKQAAALPLMIGGAAVVFVVAAIAMLAWPGSGSTAKQELASADAKVQSPVAPARNEQPVAQVVQESAAAPVVPLVANPEETPAQVAQPIAPVTTPVENPAGPNSEMAGRGMQRGPAPFDPQMGPQQGFGRGPQRAFDPNLGDPNRPPGTGPNMAINLAFEQYDSDNSGLLDPQEIPFHIVLRADANNDQLVSPQELAAAKARLAERLFEEPSEQERGSMNRGPQNERGRRGQLRRGPGLRNPQQPPQRGG